MKRAALHRDVTPTLEGPQTLKFAQLIFLLLKLNAVVRHGSYYLEPHDAVRCRFAIFGYFYGAVRCGAATCGFNRLVMGLETVIDASVTVIIGAIIVHHICRLRQRGTGANLPPHTKLPLCDSVTHSVAP